MDKLTVITGELGQTIIIDDGFGGESTMVEILNAVIQKPGAETRRVNRLLAKPNMFKHFESFIKTGQVFELHCKDVVKFNDYFDKVYWPKKANALPIKKEDWIKETAGAA